MLSQRQQEGHREELAKQIKGEYERVLARVNVEQEKWADQLLSQLYRDLILAKRYDQAEHPLQEYMEDWRRLQRDFFSQVAEVGQSSRGSGSGMVMGSVN